MHSARTACNTPPEPSADPELRLLLRNLNEQIPVEVLSEADNASDAAFAENVSSKVLCDALRWITANGSIMFVSGINVPMSSHGFLLTVTAEMQNDHGKTNEQFPIALARSPALMAHIHSQFPSLDKLVAKWNPTYRVVTHEQIRTVYTRLLQWCNGSAFGLVMAEMCLSTRDTVAVPKEGS